MLYCADAEGFAERFISGLPLSASGRGPGGGVVSILLSSTPGEPMQSVEQAEAVAGRGLVGDRYEKGVGTFSTWPNDHELTLVEGEEADAAKMDVRELRRNLVTVGVRLNDLVGKRFHVGPVLCEGTRLCEPCAHLEQITNRPGLTRTMAHKCGLRAVVLTGGIIRVNDEIVLAGETQ